MDKETAFCVYCLEPNETTYQLCLSCTRLSVALCKRHGLPIKYDPDALPVREDPDD